MLQVQQMRCSLLDASQIMKLSYGKVTSLTEKVEARLDEDLTAIYQESIRLAGPGSRAAAVWDSLKDALTFANLAAEFLEALHDSEAAAETVTSRARALENGCSLALPPNVSALVRRKEVEHLVQEGKFAEACEFLRLENVLSTEEMASATEEQKSEARAVQATCLTSCVCSLFMAPVRPCGGGDGDAAEEVRRAAMGVMIKKIVDFTASLDKTQLEESLRLDKAGLKLLDEIHKLGSLASTALASSVTAEECEGLEATRAAFLKQRQGPFYSALAMFAVGQEVCARVAAHVSQCRTDAVMETEIRAAAAIAEGFKAFVPEALLRENKDWELELFVPQQNKFADMMSKWFMYKDKSSAGLQRTLGEVAAVVESKMQELFDALIAALNLLNVRYTQKNGNLQDAIAKLCKAGLRKEEQTALEQMLKLMAHQQPFAKVPLAKLFPKDKMDDLEAVVSLITKHAGRFKDALPYLTQMHKEEEGLTECFLAKPHVGDLFGILHDHGQMCHMQTHAPFLHESMSLLDGVLRGKVSAWLLQSASTFLSFVEKILRPEVQITDVLQKDVLGTLCQYFSNTSHAVTGIF